MNNPAADFRNDNVDPQCRMPMDNLMTMKLIDAATALATAAASTDGARAVGLKYLKGLMEPDITKGNENRVVTRTE